jgi:endonuclease-3
MAKKKTAAKKIKVSKTDAKARLKKVYPLLEKTYPHAKIALNFKTPLQLLVATILSAQCTDVRVNMVTPPLFKKYPNVKAFAEAEIGVLENAIKSTGFFRNKAKNIKAAADKIISDFDGKVPDTLKELTSLPGVGRKTANVILGNVFDVAGITCDTHVIRLSRRIALSENSDPVKLEFDLMEIVPKKNWTQLSHLLIFHGRNICKARKPDCQNCPIAEFCPSASRPELW